MDRLLLSRGDNQIWDFTLFLVNYYSILTQYILLGDKLLCVFAVYLEEIDENFSHSLLLI